MADRWVLYSAARMVLRTVDLMDGGSVAAWVLWKVDHWVSNLVDQTASQRVEKRVDKMGA